MSDYNLRNLQELKGEVLTGCGSFLLIIALLFVAPIAIMFAANVLFPLFNLDFVIPYTWRVYWAVFIVYGILN